MALVRQCRAPAAAEHLVEHFNKSQEFITVALDASMRAVEISQKVAVAFAAGGAPDVAGMVAPSTQNFYNSGILEPIDPFFQQWDQKSDFYPNIVEAMRAKPGQPVLYLAYAMLAFVLYYRADWFEEAKLVPAQKLRRFYRRGQSDIRAPEPLWICVARRRLSGNAAAGADSGQRRRPIRQTRQHG